MAFLSKTITVLSTVTALWSLTPLALALEPEAIYQKASSGVVSIISIDKVKTGKAKDGTYGSGVIINPRGLIITNNHVVQKNQVFVKVTDGRVYQGTIVARDPQNDLALIQIQPQNTLSSLNPRNMSPNIGEKVYVLGNAFGTETTFTDGIVSRILDNGYIQYTAPSNPGNSGGPLLNEDGDVVGIVQLSPDKVGSHLVKGISFAIPTITVQSFLEAFNGVPGSKRQANIHLYQGLIQSRKGNHQKAIEYYNQAIDLVPDFADAYYIRGLTHIVLIDKSAAIADLQEATDLYLKQRRTGDYQDVFNQLTKLQEIN